MHRFLDRLKRGHWSFYNGVSVRWPISQPLRRGRKSVPLVPCSCRRRTSPPGLARTDWGPLLGCIRSPVWKRSTQAPAGAARASRCAFWQIGRPRRGRGSTRRAAGDADRRLVVDEGRHDRPLTADLLSATRSLFSTACYPVGLTLNQPGRPALGRCRFARISSIVSANSDALRVPRP